MNLTQLAATGSALDLALAEVRGEAKVTRLAPAKPKRGQLWAAQVNGGSTRWSPATAGNGRLKAGQLRPEEIALKAALR